jgi:hypothetical protein
MAARHVADHVTPGGTQYTINVDIGRRVFVVALIRPHPIYQTEYHLQLAYGFDTQIGREIGGWLVERMPPRLSVN